MACFREVDSGKAASILAQVEETITTSTVFNFKEARIISGAEEGAFGWITTNYLSGNFREV